MRVAVLLVGVPILVYLGDALVLRYRISRGWRRCRLESGRLEVFIGPAADGGLRTG